MSFLTFFFLINKKIKPLNLAHVEGPQDSQTMRGVKKNIYLLKKYP